MSSTHTSTGVKKIKQTVLCEGFSKKDMEDYKFSEEDYFGNSIFTKISYEILRKD